METDPASETLCFLISRVLDDGRSPKNPVIMSVIHHRQQPFRIYQSPILFNAIGSNKDNAICHSIFFIFKTCILAFEHHNSVVMWWELCDLYVISVPEW
jgi:hypothetical protein